MKTLVKMFCLSLLWVSILLSNSDLFFHKITDEEKTIYCNNLNYRSHYTKINDLFHYSTKYKFFDYSNMNQFETRKEKQKHQKLISDPSYYSNLPSEFNYKKDFDATSVLSDFDFDNSLYYIDVKKIFNSLTAPISNEVEIIDPIEGFNNKSNYTTVFFEDYPDSLALKIPNLNNAEKFSEKSVTLRLNFKILPKIVHREKYIKRDDATTMFDQWLQKAKYEGNNTKNMKNEELAIYYLDWVYRQSYGRESFVDIYKTAFNRTYFLEFYCELKSIELLSSIVGTHIWIPN